MIELTIGLVCLEFMSTKTKTAAPETKSRFYPQQTEGKCVSNSATASHQEPKQREMFRQSV